ncbi:phasin family protein [Pseudomonas capeferrum]|uniref:phasin family protein n=1 Tax=Pseudomonas capeferrum TaxID=1495066 RepID=UPI0015E47B8B|nr:phasin family protein [Pseudomonas capeferrum]MBA1204856.1 phasin family protein [Pseudomonas capeferrum]
MARVTLRKKEVPNSTLGEVRGYARKIWLAGLGAYTRAGQEGVDYFQELIKAGEGVEKRGGKRIEKAVDHGLDAANSQLNETERELTAVRGRFEVRLDKIEKAFDARVARALNRVGIPSKHDVETLSIKLEELTALLARVSRKQ